MGKSERMLAEISEKARARRSGTTMFRYDNVPVKTYMGKKYVTPSKGSFTSTIIDDIGLSRIIDTNPADIEFQLLLSNPSTDTIQSEFRS